MKPYFRFPRLATAAAVLWAAIASGEDATWTTRIETPERGVLAAVPCLWKQEGIDVRLEDAASGESFQLRLVPKKGAETAKGSKAPRAFAAIPFPAPEGEWAVLSWQRLPDGWTLYVDGAPAARFPEPWEGGVRLATPASLVPPDDTDAPADYLQRLGSFRFEDAFMVPEGTSDPLRNWEILAGDWRMHTVTGTVSGSQARARLGRQPTAEHSPNFYSLDGRGENAAIVAGEPFYDRYRMKAALHHEAGGTNGILFLVEEDLDAFGFTCRDNPEDGRLAFDLWRGRVGGAAEGAGGVSRETLRSVATDLLTGQWITLEARILPGRIECLVDGVRVLGYDGPLPPGGQFGLYQHGADGARFDDVAAGTLGDLPLDSASAIAFHTLSDTAGLRVRKGVPRSLPVPRDTPFPAGIHLSLEAAKDAEGLWLAGSTADPPRRLETVFAPGSRHGAFGLVAGWTGTNAPAWRFAVEDSGETRAARLYRGAELVDEQPLAPSKAKSVHLVLDAAWEGELAGYLDGELVVLAAPGSPVEGACGLWLAPGCEALALAPLARTSAPVYRDRFEKNMSYVNDPFMKNWASPEGQWLQTPGGDAWFRSDFLGRIDLSLPLADPLEVHLAVPEPERKEGEPFAPPPPPPGTPVVAPVPDPLPGQCQLLVSGGTATLVASGPDGSPAASASFPLEAVPNTHFDNPAADFRIAGVHLDGRLLWASCPTGILARLHLPARPTGRRVRAKGLTIDHLRHTTVSRDHVVDCLFNESLAAWTINGGKWEVVNRFQCEPSWSHMNGESASTLAALWSKMEVGGDFSMEFYAGERHGWYDRVGDFNLTVCSRKGATGDGYSVICTGWDPDSSQLRTRLLRDGATKAVSDRYLAPRFRDGNVRRVVEPLVASGRDVHGAWYAMRLRRLGPRLEYLFDNVPVFAWEDPEPLPAGLFGIWTYRNSMMVARVRILAEEIRPRRFAVRELPVAPAAKGRAPAAPAAVPSGLTNVLASTWPVEMLDPSLWTADDPVSRPVLSFSAGKGGRPAMRLEATLGGGEFSARSLLPPKPLHTVLGWSFEIARHPQARPELGFALCEPSGATNALYSFPLAAGFETRGPRRRAGSADVPATPAGAKEPVWTPVTAWIPAERAATNLQVLFEGFGVFQPSEAQEGIGATPPGAWYAVRNLRPILRGEPLFTGPEELRPLLDELEAKARAMPVGRISTLELPAAADPRHASVAWGVAPPTSMGLRAELLSDPPEAVRISSSLPWPNRDLDIQDIQLDGQAIPATFDADGSSATAWLPRPTDLSADLKVSARLRNGRIFKQVFRPRRIPGAAEATNTPPVLLALRVERGFYQGFESRSPTLAILRQRNQKPVLLQDGGSPAGTFLRIANNGAPARLQASLVGGVTDLAATPLVQFRYRRGGPLPCVSLHAIGYAAATFSEPLPGARSVRFAVPPPELPSDDEDRPGTPREPWRTWMGLLSDAIAPRPFRNGYAVQPCDLVIGSFANIDQTGRYSFIDVDAIAGGPVVGPDLPLSVTPSFYDPDGVSTVLCAVVEGPEPWDSRPAVPPLPDGRPGGAAWAAITNDAPYSPSVDGLRDGVHHLVLCASDARGAWSEPADIPFLLDRRAITVESSVVPTPNTNNGTALRVVFHTFGGSLPRFDTMDIVCKGREIDLSRAGGSAVYAPDGVTFDLNWPSLFRREIQASHDGDDIPVEFSGLSDAAGNTPASHTAHIRIDYASDKTPPTVQPPRAGGNFLWYLPEIRQPRDFIGGAPKNIHARPVVTNDEHVVELRPVEGAKNASVTHAFPQNPWQPSTHAYLALSARVLALPKEPGVPPMTLLFNPQHLPAEAKRPPDNAPFALPLPSAEGGDPPWVVAAAGTGWKPGVWRDLVIDVDAFLRDATGLDEAPPLRDFSVAMAGDASYAIQLRAAAILSAWGPDHLFTLNAYDASGVEGLVWEGGSAPELSLRPARVRLPPGTGWFEVRVKDRAGNLSPPRLVPLPPVHADGTDDLPLSEPAPEEDLP